MAGRHAGDRARQRLRAESGGVDDARGGDAHRRSPAGFDHQPLFPGAPGEDGRFERDHRAMGLGVAPQREHIGVGVDDPGRGRQQRPLSLERGLERARLLAGEPDEIGDAVGVGLGLERRELVDLAGVHRHEQLAASLVGNAERLAERVQHRLAVDAEPGLHEPRRIIDAGMDDFAVARADSRADPALALDDDHLAPGAREGPRHGKPDHPSADDETLDRFHPLPLCSAGSVLRRPRLQRT